MEASSIPLASSDDINNRLAVYTEHFDDLFTSKGTTFDIEMFLANLEDRLTSFERGEVQSCYRNETCKCFNDKFKENSHKECTCDDDTFFPIDDLKCRTNSSCSFSIELKFPTKMKFLKKKVFRIFSLDDEDIETPLLDIGTRKIMCFSKIGRPVEFRVTDQQWANQFLTVSFDYMSFTL